MSQPEDWDKLLPEEHRPAWEAWCQSLSVLENLSVPRSYASGSLEAAGHREIHTFCNASSDAIGEDAYLRTIHPDGSAQVSFVLGKAKLAPAQATTIPRLELCAAVLGIELTETITEELDQQPDSVTYYSDSKVVLVYISNQTRRFYVYVSNRVERITRSSTPDQWHYVCSSHNSADLATRPSEAQNLQNTIWHTGPKFLESQDPSSYTQPGNAVSESKSDDPEVRLELKTLVTQLRQRKSFGCQRFSKYSQWSTLLKAISRLIVVARSYRQKNYKEQRVFSASPQVLHQVETIIIKTVQGEAYRDVIDSLKNFEKQPKSSSLLKLCPVIDTEGLLRVGGRLDRASLSQEERHPLILPSSQHVATLLVRHYHAKVQHQGRRFTLGAIRSSGFWIVGGKRLVGSIIDKCIKCKKLRGSQQQQKMADLPVERLTPAPPFSYVGLDVFGPWQVAARRTRGGVAHSKRWAVLFTCLTTRAIHIELIESLDSSSFINALRRFLALRGPVIQLRSDCGTNFVGAHNELDASLREMDKEAIQAYLVSEGCEWIFNPPHASHAGGVWNV